MTCIFESVYYGGTRLDGVSGQWTRSVTRIDVGDIEYQIDRIGAGLRPGEIEIAEVLARGIPINVTMRSYMTGSVASLYGAERDEAAAIRRILQSPGTDVSYLQVTRKDGSNADVTREIPARVIGSPHHKIIQPKSGMSGSLAKPGNGVVEVSVRMYALFPYWRDVAEVSQTVTATSTAGSLTLTAGNVGLGARFAFSSAVNFPAIVTITNTTTGSVFVVNFGATISGDYIDWFHTLPTTFDALWSHADTYLAAGGSCTLDAGANSFTLRTSVGGDTVSIAAKHWKYYDEL